MKRNGVYRNRMVIDSLKYNGKCSCGIEHTMETVFSVVESGALRKLNQYLSEFDLKGVTIAVFDDAGTGAKVFRLCIGWRTFTSYHANRSKGCS